MRVTVHLWPPLSGDPLAASPRGRPGASTIRPGASAVIIDVLRATTTLTVALSHGATRVIPAATPRQALALRDRTTGALLCGERDGRMLAGFDLGNSPFEYTVTRVSGRPLVFASTNGSLALLFAQTARRRLLASFVNVSAALRRLEGEAEIAIVCAGKLGGFALEDAACAGWMCARLEERGAVLHGPHPRLARALAPRDGAEVRALVQGASHGRYLRAMGGEFARDVEFCAGLDTLDQAFEV